jgi:hypothetical protein
MRIAARPTPICVMLMVPVAAPVVRLAWPVPKSAKPVVCSVPLVVTMPQTVSDSMSAAARAKSCRQAREGVHVVVDDRLAVDAEDLAVRGQRVDLLAVGHRAALVLAAAWMRSSDGAPESWMRLMFLKSGANAALRPGHEGARRGLVRRAQALVGRVEHDRRQVAARLEGALPHAVDRHAVGAHAAQLEALAHQLAQRVARVLPRASSSLMLRRVGAVQQRVGHHRAAHRPRPAPSRCRCGRSGWSPRGLLGELGEHAARASSIDLPFFSVPMSSSSNSRVMACCLHSARIELTRARSASRRLGAALRPLRRARAPRSRFSAAAFSAASSSGVFMASFLVLAASAGMVDDFAGVQPILLGGTDPCTCVRTDRNQGKLAAPSRRPAP